MIGIAARVESCYVEPALGKKFGGGEIVGSCLGGNRPQVAGPGLADHLIHHRRSQPLAAVLEVDPEVHNANGAVLRLVAGHQHRHVYLVVLRQKSHPFFRPFDHLVEQELRLVGRLIAVHPFFPQGALLQLPRRAKFIAGAVDVQVEGGFDGAVNVDQPVQVTGADGADFHHPSIPRRRPCHMPIAVQSFIVSSTALTNRNGNGMLAPAPPHEVPRQVSLPLGKAVEIAYKNIRLRLGRSLLVTSGIVLALAFLMSILANRATLDGMRHWARWAPASARFDRLRDQRAALEDRMRPREARLRLAARRAGESARNQSPDLRPLLGQDPAELQKELGIPLPAPPSDLAAAVAHNVSLADDLRQWVADARDLKRLREELTAPERLGALLQTHGDADTGQSAARRTQTRWLVALALLVAFVGILNAMLMSVTERFREIGTMKCLGALDEFIIKLFLLESLFQGIVGAAFGVVIGLALSLLATLLSYGTLAFQDFGATGLDILGGAGICLGVGIGLTIAGALYPAWQAARMQPIEAMRVEA